MPDSANGAPAAPPILEMRGITKRFPGVLALDNVDFRAQRGEIHSLMGQNGAGKSTLMKILAGDYPPSSGQIFIDGQQVTFHSPQDARRKGVALVYQELSLLANLTVADNIFLGREPGSRLSIDERTIYAESAAVLNQLGVETLRPEAMVGELPLAQQQLVEIAKALALRPRILILDEPTAALTPSDAERLFAILNRLKAQDIAIVYITHRLKEILAHCDTGTVLRNGRVVETLPITPQTTEEALIELMIGQQVESYYHRGRVQKGAGGEMLAVEELTVPDRVYGVSFTLRSGEILGITGLLGAGQNEMARALFGIMPGSKATFRRSGQEVSINSPGEAIERGICLLTEHRKAEGLFLEMSVKENITLPSLPRFLQSRLVRLLARRKEESAAGEMVRMLDIAVRTPDALVRTLSGGNQQKAILGRWLLRQLEVLVFIEPTRGVDVGAKAEIYRYLNQLADEGRSIIVVSPELPEILGISDRILVMYEGRLIAEYAQGEATEEALLSALQGSAPVQAPTGAAAPAARLS